MAFTVREILDNPLGRLYVIRVADLLVEMQKDCPNIGQIMIDLYPLVTVQVRLRQFDPSL